MCDYLSVKMGERVDNFVKITTNDLIFQEHVWSVLLSYGNVRLQTINISQ